MATGELTTTLPRLTKSMTSVETRRRIVRHWRGTRHGSMNTPTSRIVNIGEALIQIKARCRVRCTFDGEAASESDFGAFQ
jgi:hypothetical protein